MIAIFFFLQQINRTNKRTNQNDSNNNPKREFCCLSHPRTHSVLVKKSIKAKKRHEIERMSQLTASIANDLGVKYIVDFGSGKWMKSKVEKCVVNLMFRWTGLGHLARMLAYGYKLNVCCLEKEHDLTEQAKYVRNVSYISSYLFFSWQSFTSNLLIQILLLLRIDIFSMLDDQMTDLTKKFCTDELTFQRPVHLNVCLSKNTSFEDLVEVSVLNISCRKSKIFRVNQSIYSQDIKRSFKIGSNDTSFKFGIIGLHPCGDLAPILTNFFLQSSEAKFLNLVGCCYFKITTLDVAHKGYPLSSYLSTANLSPKWQHLSFEAREIACHAIEVYAKRLSDKNYDYLRVHSFRAAIETIICKYWPDKKRSGLKSIKRLTTFRDYCHQAVSYMDEVTIPDCDIDSVETVRHLDNWKQVVIFYTLRLMLAPIVENIILYDRLLFLLEHGTFSTFDKSHFLHIFLQSHNWDNFLFFFFFLDLFNYRMFSWNQCDLRSCALITKPHFDCH